MLRCLVLAILILVAVGSGRALAAEKLATLVVEAGKADRIDTPVSVSLEGIDAAKPLRLEEVKGAERLAVPAQVEPGVPARLWFILAGKTAAGATRTFELVSAAPPDAPKIEVRADKDGLDIVCGDLKILRYRSTMVVPPEGVDKKFTRSGYINPCWTPSGLIVTDDIPPGHLHHKGVWMPWTKTEFEGRHPDFWNLGGGTGTVRFVRMGPTTGGPVFASFQANQEQVDLSAPGGGKVALKEVWNVRVYRVGGPDKGYWLWDFMNTQRCASDSPLKLPKYLYGGMGFRGAREWLGADKCQFLTSEGKDRKTGNESTGRWCDVSGTVGGKPAGVVIMGHPQNFRFPEPMRLHPTEPFFCFAPSQAGDWAIEPGKDYVFRYRFYVHDGPVKPEDANRMWADFGEPPVVKITR